MKKNILFMSFIISSAILISLEASETFTRGRFTRKPMSVPTGRMSIFPGEDTPPEGEDDVMLVGTWCHKGRTPASIGAAGWELPSLPWVGATFDKNFGGSPRTQSGRPIAAGGQTFICQHFEAKAAMAHDATWEIIDNGNGKFTLKFYHIPAGIGQYQYVFQESPSGNGRGKKARLSNGGTTYNFTGIPVHVDPAMTIEPAEDFASKW